MEDFTSLWHFYVGAKAGAKISWPTAHTPHNVLDYPIKNRNVTDTQRQKLWNFQSPTDICVQTTTPDIDGNKRKRHKKLSRGSELKDSLYILKADSYRPQISTITLGIMNKASSSVSISDTGILCGKTR